MQTEPLREWMGTTATLACRISPCESKFTTGQEINRAVEILVDSVTSIRQAIGIIPSDNKGETAVLPE